MNFEQNIYIRWDSTVDKQISVLSGVNGELQLWGDYLGYSTDYSRVGNQWLSDDPPGYQGTVSEKLEELKKMK